MKFLFVAVVLVFFLQNCHGDSSEEVGGGFSCSGRGAGYYPGPGCRVFYRCVVGDNRAHTFNCPAGLKFDRNSNHCVEPHTANC